MENILFFNNTTAEVSLIKNDIQPCDAPYHCILKRVKDSTENGCTLVYGHLFRDGEFFEASFSTLFVRVDLIKEILSHIEFNLTIFNKDYTQHAKYNGSVNSLQQFLKVVNFFNRFINSSNSIEELNLALLNGRLNLIGNDSLIKLVKAVKIDLYENSRIRVGKDNNFWIEMVFWSYSTTDYFKELLIRFLEENFHKPKIIYNEPVEEYHIETQRENAWLPSFDRRVLSDKDLETEIRIRLSLWMAANFDYNIYEIDLYKAK